MPITQRQKGFVVPQEMRKKISDTLKLRKSNYPLYLKMKKEKATNKSKFYYHKYIEKYRARNNKMSRQRMLKHHYGMTIEQYNEMFALQQGKCQICKKHQSELKQILTIDHSHTTKHIRGLLCRKCNTMLGMADEQIMTFYNAIEYLMRRAIFQPLPS